jgi:hypothetical protein
MNWNRVRPIILLSAAIVLAVFAPEPRIVGTNQCGEGVGRLVLACYWFSETLRPWFDAVVIPIWKLALVPGFVVAAVWTVRRDTGRAMAVTLFIAIGSATVLPLAIYSSLFLLAPLARAFPYVFGFLQYVVLIWPQQVLFALRGTELLPYRWSYLLPVGFWLVAAFIFALLARRARSLRVQVPAAAAYVVVLVCLVVWVVPMLGWKIRIELP